MKYPISKLVSSAISLGIAIVLICIFVIFFNPNENNSNNSGTITSPSTTKLTVSEVTHSVFYAPQYVAINLGLFGLSNNSCGVPSSTILPSSMNNTLSLMFFANPIS